MNEREWEWRMSEIPEVRSGLSPTDWQREFWHSFDSLVFHLNALKAQLPDDVTPGMEEIEEYINQMREELIPIEAPHRPAYIGSIKSVEPRKGCPGELMIIQGTGFGEAEEVSGTVRPSATPPSDRELILPEEGGCRAATDLYSWTDTEIRLPIPSWARSGNIGIRSILYARLWEEYFRQVNGNFLTIRQLISQNLGSAVAALLPPLAAASDLCPPSRENNFFEGTVPEVVKFEIEKLWWSSTREHMVNANHAKIDPGPLVIISWEIQNADSIQIKEGRWTGLDEQEYPGGTVLYSGSNLAGKIPLEFPQNPSLQTLSHPLYGKYTYTLEATNSCGTVMDTITLDLVVPPLKVWNFNFCNHCPNFGQRISNIVSEVGLRDRNGNKASDLFGFNECRNQPTKIPPQFQSVETIRCTLSGGVSKLLTPECFGLRWRETLPEEITGGGDVNLIWEQYGELGYLINGMKFEIVPGSVIRAQIKSVGFLGLGSPLLLLGVRLRIVGTDLIVPFYTTHIRGSDSAKKTACENIVETIVENWEPSDLPPILVGDFNFDLNTTSPQGSVMKEYFFEIREHFELPSDIEHIWIGLRERFPSEKGIWIPVAGSFDEGRIFADKGVNFSDHNCPSVDLRIV